MISADIFSQINVRGHPLLFMGYEMVSERVDCLVFFDSGASFITNRTTPLGSEDGL